MKALNFELKGLCERMPHGSAATRAARFSILQQCAAQLVALGFGLKHPAGLKPKHVSALVQHWQGAGLSPGTVKNRLAHLRWWAEQVGKASVIPRDNEELGVPARVMVKGNRAIALDLAQLERVQDVRVRMALRLQAAFGLRREEALKFRPALADKGDHLALKASWCKGGRARVVPVLTPRQRALLDECRALVGGGSLIPDGKTYVKHLRAYRQGVLEAGINQAHGLRHAYAQWRYRSLTGWACPAAGGPGVPGLSPGERARDLWAREVISVELGHNRVDVTAVYLGGRG